MNAENLRQIVIPHTLFVGDTGEVKVYFSTEAEFENSSLTTEFFTKPLTGEDFTVKKIVLVKNGKTVEDKNTYELSILFTPWKTGEIKIPSYNLGKFFEKDDFCITIDNITIESIFTQKNIDQTFQGIRGPLLIPGTTYKVFICCGILLIILIALIRCLVKWQDISLKMKQKILQFQYRLNKKRTLKMLKRICSQNQSDKETASQIQSVLRNYLNYRYSYSFSNCATSEIGQAFDTIFQGLLSDEKQAAVEDLTAVFIRTDFIRYGKNNNFFENEKSELLNIITKLINTLEFSEAK